MSTPAGFIHLRVHSAYSLLEGAIPIKSLVKWCVAEKMPAVAITDSGNLFGSLEFAMAARDAGIQPIQSALLFTKPQAVEGRRSAQALRPDQIIAIAKNDIGWKNLLHIVSQAHLNPVDGNAPVIEQRLIEQYSDGLIILVGGIESAIGRMLQAGKKVEAEAELLHLLEVFGDRVYIELSRHGLTEEALIENTLIEMAYKHNIPLVATNDAYFIDDDMYEAHDAFLCIAEGCYVGDEKRRRLTPEHRLKTPKQMQALFADIPEALANTLVIAKRCSVMAPTRKPILPSFTKEGLSEADTLRAEAKAGLEERLQHFVFKAEMDEVSRAEIAKPYYERLEFELDVIIKMQFPGYFLIVSDFIKWSKAHDIPVGPGRGSGAGSLVAWSLFITDLDPLRYGLLFERFLNPERVSMPDFDVDFCQDRREEVIQYVQQKYGSDRVAQIITFGKLQARAVLRDAGRVLQMPYGQVDRICKLVPNNPANPVTLAEAIKIEPLLQAAIDEDETVSKLADISLKLEGLNRHASTHAAGVVIADRPLSELVPMYRDPKSDMPVVQYSMKYAESAGLVKFDFLGLKTLTVLSRTLKLLEPRNIRLDLLALPEGDKPTYEMLSRGETVGVFQLESAGMRDTLKKLKPDTLEDIIALVSLYRPGPMDNIPTYIARKHGEEQPDYLHPLLEPVLKETFGVIIYQEQVMQIAQVLAGYRLGEADLLRRAMGKKIREEMEAQRGIFVEKAIARDIPNKQAASIFDLIAKFAEYGFNKSHAAAYALIAYQTAFLKANYPVEFIAASMTYDMHNTDKLSIFREDAAQYGIQLLAPDINRSQVLFSVENGHIRYALAAIRNVGAQAMQAVVTERDTHGVYKDIFDFASRVSAEALNKRALEYLIKAGAFDTLHPNRAALFAQLDTVVAYGAAMQRERESDQVSLFAGSNQPSIAKPKMVEAADWTTLERLEHEFTAIGFYLSSHPLADYEASIRKLGVVASNELAEKLSGAYRPVKLAGIVTGKKFKVSDKGRFAFIQLSDMGGVFEVSVFNEGLLMQHRDNLENGRVLFIQAEGKSEDAGVRLIAQSISLLDDAVKKVYDRGLSKFRIVINESDAITPLRDVLGEGGRQGAQVVVSAQLESLRTEIELPGKYALTPALLDKLRVIKGVVLAEEIAA